MPWQFITIAVAGLIGLTVLAFRHPVGYRIAALIVTFAWFAAWGMLAGYNAGLSKGFRSAVSFIPLEKVKALSDTIDSASFDTAWFPVISIIGVFYLVFLFLLPILIARDRRARQERK